jgi:hypothetical protein
MNYVIKYKNNCFEINKITYNPVVFVLDVCEYAGTSA